MEFLKISYFLFFQDAHNCILDFDDKDGPTAFFAVYDGHGGSEVAEYCSLKLPAFLKLTEAYKNGDIDQALKDTFINFDQTLLKPEVIAELKDLAKKNPDYEGSDEEDEDEENIRDLYQEAKMPLKDVLEKYSKPLSRLEQLKTGSSAKPLSPCLKAKSSSRISGEEAGGSSSATAGPAPSASSSAEAGGSGSKKSIDADDTVSSSSSKQAIAKESEPSSTSAAGSSDVNSTECSTTEAPGKSDCAEPKALVNGDVTGSEEKASKSVDDLISSSSVLENGEVSSNSKTSSQEACAGSSSGSVDESLPTRAAKINSITSSSRAIALDDEDEDTTTGKFYFKLEGLKKEFQTLKKGIHNVFVESLLGEVFKNNFAVLKY